MDGRADRLIPVYPRKYSFCEDFLSGVFFHLSPLQKHVRKVEGGFGKKSCVSTGVRKPGNACASPTAIIMTLAVKVALNRNTTNQPNLRGLKND